MRRRQFFGACAGAAAMVSALTSSAGSPAGPPCRPGRNSEGLVPPFSLSVMLWTVYQKLPFASASRKSGAGRIPRSGVSGGVQEFYQAGFRQISSQKARTRPSPWTPPAASLTACVIPLSATRFWMKCAPSFPVLEELECRKLICFPETKFPVRAISKCTIVAWKV